jgi:outer membrane protein assembly factor BamB
MNRLIVVPLIVFQLCVLQITVVADDNWPQFRGTRAAGIGTGNPPIKWDVEAGTNIAWKTPLPGLGHSSPIVWGNFVFLTTAVNSETETPSLETGWLGGSGKSAPDQGDWTWLVICLELSSGKLLWTKDALAGQPQVKRHLKASHANCTPATDGRHVVAFFGSEGLHCFDVTGKFLWRKDLGRLHSGPYDEKLLEWGFASSPIIHDGKVIVQCDCLNTAFVSIIDIATGEEISRIDREGEVATWSTPQVITTNAGEQLVCNGYRKIAGYNLLNGKLLWHLHGGGDVPVPTPLFDGGLIYITNGHGNSPIYVVEPSATGDLTPKSNKPASGLKWFRQTDGAYMPTPLVKDGLLYVGNDNGRLTVCDAQTGEVMYRQRVGSGSRVYSASAVAAGGHLYYCSERGEVTVVKEGRTFQAAAQNEMREVIMASPALSGDRLVIRTISQVICIRPDGPAAP